MSKDDVRGLIDPARYPDAPSADDPSYLRAAAWLSSPPKGEAVATILGVPFSSLSISKARCDLLPAAVREAMWSFSTHAASSGIDLSEQTVEDLGDVMLSDLPPDDALQRIQEAVSAVDGRPLIVVGGDNSVTAPAFLSTVGREGALITLDAHHDVRDYRTAGITNGSPVRVLLDSGVAGERVWQIGISDWVNSRAYTDFAKEEGINVVNAVDVRSRGVSEVITHALRSMGDRRVYVDFDIDVVERALVPGAPAARPGGLSPQDLIDAAWICGLDPKVEAIDLVEVDPSRDVAGATVRLVCLVLLTFLAGVTQRSQRR